MWWWLVPLFPVYVLVGILVLEFLDKFFYIEGFMEGMVDFYGDSKVYIGFMLLFWPVMSVIPLVYWLLICPLKKLFELIGALVIFMAVRD